MTEESDALHPPPQLMPESTTRPVGGTEYSWCKSVLAGTGITVLGLLLSKSPDIQLIQTALHNLQNSHPILRSKLHLDASTNTFHFITPLNSHIRITPFDLQSTSRIIGIDSNDRRVSPFHRILEHELNRNSWRDSSGSIPDDDTDIFHVAVYTISDRQWAVFLRLHTAGCDRTAAVALLRGLLGRVSGRVKGTEMGLEEKEKVELAIENLIPEGKANKPFWARGLDMIGYSLNSLRFANLNFMDADSPRSSEVAKLQLDTDETERLVAGCKSRGIKLCGALAAAGMIASWSYKRLPYDQREKYGIVTLTDCRSILDPVLSSNHLGFYHSAILNTHDVGGETLWELAKRSYISFENAKNCNKHFTDMSDLNYLMCKAIDNPGLTPCSSLRTGLISVFEDPVIDDSDSDEIYQELGLEDYEGCSSVHGVGPSIAIFDTIRHGRLDCACVYPSPLHSREQILTIIDHMKKILVDAGNIEDQ
ncbi:condensation domain protein [Senna tora]|uniref:Condensation domain protein n=1 Tax=Senna tora TaxID=362788 RepID=A0A834SIN0_9FABA|nr:condensation domain protein [Senna tora]